MRLILWGSSVLSHCVQGCRYSDEPLPSLQYGRYEPSLSCLRERMSLTQKGLSPDRRRHLIARLAFVALPRLLHLERARSSYSEGGVEIPAPRKSHLTPLRRARLQTARTALPSRSQAG